MFKNILLFLVTLFFAVNLFANEVQENKPSNIRTGWFGSIGAGLGSGLEMETDGDYHQEVVTNFMGFPFRDSRDSDRSNTFKSEGMSFIPALAVGYEWQNWGLEFAISNHQDKFKSTDFKYYELDDGVDSKFKATYTDFMFNGYYKFNISNFPVTPFVGIGVGYSHIKLDWTIHGDDIFSGEGAPSNTVDAAALALFAGVQYNINQNMSLTFDAKVVGRTGFEYTRSGSYRDNGSIVTLSDKTTFNSLNTFSMNVKFKYYM